MAECTSVLNRQVHFERMDSTLGRQQVERLFRIPIRIVHHGALHLRAFDIARSLGWKNAYDALYLAAAEYERAELLTVDGGMREAAKRLGLRATLVAD
jgi:predicted nucleic acid-binding protein